MDFEKFLEEFDVEPKNPSEAAIRRWRSAVSIVKNRRRRFRMTADLDKRSEAEQKKLKIQEKIRVALYVQKAALHFIDAGARVQYTLSDEAREAGFSIPADELASIVRGHDIRGLKFHGGVEGIARKVSVSLDEGVHESDIRIRQKIFGINRYTEKPPRIFLMFVWDALQDLTLIMLMVCAVLSIGVGLPTEGWPVGIYDGLGILLSVILVVMVTAISDYKQSLQFIDLDREKKKISIQAIFQNTGSEVVKDKEGKNTILGTPTEIALLELGLLLGGDFKAQRNEFKIIKVEPFNSVRKKMSVLVALPEGGLRAFCKGASEIVLEMCDKFIDDSGETVPLSEEKFQEVTDIINGFASEALRTLCLVFKDLNYSSDENNIPDNGYTLIAVVGIKDPVRPGVKEAVQTCLAAGITVRMVTGDNINTAKAIARECGILTPDGVAVEGPDFRNMSPDEMNHIIPNLQVMARSMPLDKHTLVTQLKNTFGEVVAVTGDGTNDAPALKESDIGLAMGIAGTEVAKENADIIVLDDNFSTIVNVAKWGRSVYINIQKFVQFQLTVNIVALTVNFVSACISGSAPLTAVQLLWLLRLSGSDATDVLDTVIFNSFVFCQVFNEINSRDMEKINIFRGMFDSWLFMGVMVGTVVFQVIIVEFLGDLASTVPLSWQLWLFCVLIGAVSMPISVVIKFIPVGKSTTAKPKHRDGYQALPSGPELA
ncbi:hypothetical protein QYF36_016761 [Acer negundo]|nr:hypothetical protein QYF36_016761 [Acer negundo]